MEIQRGDITVDTIPAGKITYVGYDWAGRVDKLVLNDVTGDRYLYGMVYYEMADEDAENPVSYDKVTLKNGSGDYTFHTLYMSDVRSGRMGGVAPSLDQIAGETKVSAYMPLQEAKGVLRSQFDLDAMILTTNSMVIPVAEAVQCYNKATGEWYEVKDGDGKEALKLALAFSNDLTVYYDRSPEKGGKIRVVVAQ